MPVNKDAFLRYKIINQCLMNKRKPYPTMEYIKEQLEKAIGKPFSTSTVQKDIKSMKEDELLGYLAPIEFHRSHLGYYYSDLNYSIDGLAIDDEELEAMSTAMSFMKSLEGTAMGRNYTKALEKIYTKLAIDKQAGLYSNSFIIPEIKPDTKGLEVFDLLANHIYNKNVIEIVHYSFQRQATSKHVLHPYALKEFNNQWYLVGHSDGHKEVRTFGLNRIQHIKHLKIEKYKYPHNFNPEEYFRDCLGISRDPKQKKETIRLWFSHNLSPYIESNPIHSSQRIRKSKRFEIEIEVFVTVELVSKLLSYGRNVKVISPQWLYDDIRKNHKLAIGLPAHKVKVRL